MQAGFKQCIAHKRMITEIIYTGRAGPDKARQCRTKSGRDGPGPLGPTAQDRSGQPREVPSSAGQRRTGPGGVMKSRSVPDRAGQDLAWSADPDRDGKCSVRQCRAGGIR